MTSRLLSTHLLARAAAVALVALLVLLLGAAGPAVAAPEAAVLASDGAVLQLHSGSYADLFPQQGDLAADSQVLALDVRRGGTVDRLLVPGTESAAAETVATLLFEGGSGLTYLLWEGLLNGTHPVLYLTTWDGERWGEIFDVTGNPLAGKGDPRLIVTRDLDPAAEEKRTILHLTWWEETVDGVRWLYAPIVIDNGERVDERPVRSLSSYLGRGDEIGHAAPAPLGLLQAGASEGSQIAAFVDERHRLDAVEIEVVPQALSRLASAVSDEIAALGDSVTHADAVDAVRRAIFLHGGGFHPSTLVFLAEEIAALLVDPALAGDGYENASAGAGIHIIHIGMRLGTAGIDEGDASEIVAIRGVDGGLHHLKISVLGSWAMPEAPRDAAEVMPRLFVSRDGGDALLAWPLRHRVLYLETTEDGGWTGARAVRLDADLDAESALEMLEARTLSR